MDAATGNPLRRVSRGVYVLAEHTFYREADNPSQGLAAFLRYGRASAAVNPVASSASIGFIYTGLLPGRDDDVFGIATTRARASTGNQIANGLEATETVVEIAYKAQVTPWLAIQPVLQRITNPGFNPALGNASVGQVRFEIVF